MFRTIVSSLLGLCGALLILSTLGFAQELQTPSLKVEIDVGLDQDPTPFSLSCEGFEFDEESEGEEEVHLLPVAVYSIAVQTPPFAIDALLLVEAGAASLTQTPSDTLADWVGQGHSYVELGEDLNADLQSDAVYYFDIRDVFATQTACLAAKTVQFKLQIDTASGPIILVGADDVEPQSSPEPSEPEPVAQAFGPVTLGQAFATSQASGAIRFVAQGAGIQATRVEVYGLSGALVFDSGFGAGNTVQWKGLDRFGFSVSNGVYLYVISVQGAGGQTLRSKVGKLAILR